MQRTFTSKRVRPAGRTKKSGALQGRRRRVHEFVERESAALTPREPEAKKPEAKEGQGHRLWHGNPVLGEIVGNRIQLPARVAGSVVDYHDAGVARTEHHHDGATIGYRAERVRAGIVTNEIRPGRHAGNRNIDPESGERHDRARASRG